MSLELKEVKEILELCVLSHYIEDNEDKSISIILIAEPELDKTRSLKRFFEVKGIKVETDLTYIGIINHLLPEIQIDRIKTFIVPDMVKPIMKKQATIDNFISILMSLIEEGVHTITLRDTKNFQGARANMLTSITPKLFLENKSKWNKMGFLSRLLPFSYSYNEKKRQAILKAIEKKEVTKPIPINLEIPEFKKKIELSEKISKLTAPLIERLLISERARYTDKRTKEFRFSKKGQGFRHKHQFNSLLRANALLRKDNKVTIEDFKKIERLSKWINYEFNEI